MFLRFTKLLNVSQRFFVITLFWPTEQINFFCFVKRGTYFVLVNGFRHTARQIIWRLLFFKKYTIKLVILVLLYNVTWAMPVPNLNSIYGIMTKIIMIFVKEKRNGGLTGNQAFDLFFYQRVLKIHRQNTLL